MPCPNCCCDCIECVICGEYYNAAACGEDFEGVLEDINNVIEIYSFDVFANVCYDCMQKEETVFKYLHFNDIECGYCIENGLNNLNLKCTNVDDDGEHKKDNKWIIIHTMGKEHPAYGCNKHKECIDKQIMIECGVYDCNTRYCWHELNKLIES